MANLFREFNEEKVKEIKNHPYFAGLVPAILKQAEAFMAKEPERIKFSMIHLFATTGNRIIFQRVYENYESRMRCYFLAYIFTEDEKYIEPLADIIWNICDFESWSIPAHVGENLSPEMRRVNLDLTSTIMGYRIAEILYYIGDKLPDLVKRRAEYEVRLRVIESYKKYDHFWWMRAENNWSAVCIGAVFSAFAYLASREETDAQLERMIKTSECYLRGFDDDGCCKEGYGYWNYGFSYYCLFASMVRDYTDGKIDLFRNPKVHAIALFQQNAAINEKETISFSDAGRGFSPSPWLSHFLKNEYPDIEIPSMKCPMYASAGLRYIFWMRPEFAECKMNPKSHIYHDNQWFIYRSDNYNFAFKAGCNDEPHNHNDVGSFIISKNVRTSFTDPGGGEYTRQYFSKERYDLIACSSRGHSVPIINGQYQVTGKQKSVIYTEKENEYEFSMENAYAVPELEALKRHVVCEKDEVVISDTYKFSGKPTEIKERFVSVIKPTINENGTVECADTVLVYDSKQCDVVLSEEILRKSGYDETVYLLDLIVKEPEKEMTVTFALK